jgi:hypothetical protein
LLPFAINKVAGSDCPGDHPDEQRAHNVPLQKPLIVLRKRAQAAGTRFRGKAGV